MFWLIQRSKTIVFKIIRINKLSSALSKLAWNNKEVFRVVVIVGLPFWRTRWRWEVKSISLGICLRLIDQILNYLYRDCFHRIIRMKRVPNRNLLLKTTLHSERIWFQSQVLCRHKTYNRIHLPIINQY